MNAQETQSLVLAGFILGIGWVGVTYCAYRGMRFLLDMNAEKSSLDR